MNYFIFFLFFIYFFFFLKVPSSASEALASSLMGFFEKRRCAKLLQFIEKYDPEKPQTHEGILNFY